MQIELIKEVVVSVVGKQFEEVAELLNSKKHVNEFLIAKKLDVTINQTRNILYKLSDFGLVSSIRKKDKKKGWYTYFWRFENLKGLEYLKNLLTKKIEQINYQINNRESKQFYVCERCKLEFNEENALFMNFTCDECGDVFVVKDNTKILKELKKALDKFEKELAVVEEELSKEKEKLEKAKLKQLEKEKKERLARLAENRKARAKAREAAKKTTKRTSVKKVAKKAATKKTASKKSTKKVVKKTVKKKLTKKVSKTTTKKATKKTKSKK